MGQSGCDVDALSGVDLLVFLRLPVGGGPENWKGYWILWISSIVGGEQLTPLPDPQMGKPSLHQ